MDTITFECEVITPMFLAGADGTTPELRAPSIKGALRFWWRAMNGHLSLDDKKDRNGKIIERGMRTIEGEIFGSTSQRSKVIVICEQKEFEIVDQHKMIAHKEGASSKSFKTSEILNITLKLVKNVEIDKKIIFDFERLKALFEIFCYLGGLGKRSRRANGGLKITKLKEGNGEPESYTTLIFQSTLLEKLNNLTLCQRNDNSKVFDFEDASKSIKSNFQMPNTQMPYIKEIFFKEKEKENIDSLRRKISQATHDTKSEDNNRAIAKAKEYQKKTNGQNATSNDYKRFLMYGKVVGNGSPRFASPVIFSIPNDENVIIILLNTVSYISTQDLTLQNNLINKL